LTVIDRDLHAGPVTEVHAANVLLTLLDGRAAYRATVLR
jgi:predicted amidohydrolase YtcJ